MNTQFGILDKIISDLHLKATTFDCPKRQALKELDLVVLDNSIRESTVGQLRGHTLENKWKIYDEVKTCGFKFIVVAAFSHMTRVDDTFIQELIAEGEDPKDLFAFTEAFEHKRNLQAVPVGKFMTRNLLKVNSPFGSLRSPSGSVFSDEKKSGKKFRIFFFFRFFRKFFP